MLWTFRSRLKFEDLAAVVNRRYPTQSGRRELLFRFRPSGVYQ
jgi:hypothetical protein